MRVSNLAAEWDVQNASGLIRASINNEGNMNLTLCWDACLDMELRSIPHNYLQDPEPGVAHVVHKHEPMTGTIKDYACVNRHSFHSLSAHIVVMESPSFRTNH